MIIINICNWWLITHEYVYYNYSSYYNYYLLLTIHDIIRP